MAPGRKHDKIMDSHQGPPYASFNDKQYGLWADHVTLFTVPSVACTGTANSTQWYKCNELTWHLSHHSVMVRLQTVSETLGTNSILTQLVTWEDFIEFGHRGSFKSQATCHVTACYNLTFVRYGSLDKAPVNTQPQTWQWKC
jgi:hypothetical protein